MKSNLFFHHVSVEPIGGLSCLLALPWPHCTSCLSSAMTLLLKEGPLGPVVALWVAGLVQSGQPPWGLLPSHSTSLLRECSCGFHRAGRGFSCHSLGSLYLLDPSLHLCLLIKAPAPEFGPALAIVLPGASVSAHQSLPL